MESYLNLRKNDSDDSTCAACDSRTFGPEAKRGRMSVLLKSTPQQARGGSGVALSREQFNRAEDEGLKYWLYVVEKALDDDYVIHRIQDPAKRANEFVYDGGWKLLSSD